MASVIARSAIVVDGIVASIFLGGIHYSDSFTFGSLIVALIVGAAGIWSGVISKRRTEDLRTAANAWKEERDAERAKADRLEQEKADLLVAHNEELLQLKTALAHAEARTDITRVEQLITTSYKEAISERDLQHRERLAIIENVREQTLAGVEISQKVIALLDSMRASIDSNTEAVRSLLDQKGTPV